MIALVSINAPLKDEYLVKKFQKHPSNQRTIAATAKAAVL
jgi:hypothetical protein